MGSFVNATVYVFFEGALTDANAVWLVVAMSPLGTALENISLFRVSDGTYTGIFQITANLTASTYPALSLNAEATVGYLTGTASVSVQVPARAELRTSIALSTSEGMPGGTVQGTLTVTWNGAPRTPEFVNVSVGTYPLLFWRVAYPPIRFVSTGVYSFSFTVPASLNVSTMMLVVGTASLSEANETFSAGYFAYLPVELPDPFIVWYNTSDWSRNETYLDVWVATNATTPVSDARVLVYLPLSPQYPLTPPIAETAMTNSSGGARLSISLNGASSFYFWGVVTQGTLNQSFEGSVQSLSGIHPPAPGFSVRRNNVLEIFEPGEAAVLNYSALFDYAPLTGTELYYDVHNASTLIGFGRVAVPPSGAFAIRFAMPRDAATLDFIGEMPNGKWSESSDAVQAAMRLDAQVGAFRTGATTRLTAPLPAGGAPWKVSVDFYPHDLSAYPELRAEWASASDAAWITPGIDVTTAGPTAFEVNLTLPAYLPSNRPYFLQVTAVPGAPASASGSHALPYVFRELVYVAGPPSPSGGVLLVLPLVAVVGAAIIVALVLRRRRRFQEPPSRAERSAAKKEASKPRDPGAGG